MVSSSSSSSVLFQALGPCTHKKYIKAYTKTHKNTQIMQIEIRLNGA